MEMLMFAELSEASLYLPGAAGGLVSCGRHVSLRSVAPKRLKVAGFSLNFSTDVTSCSCAMTLMKTCFLSGRRCRRAALFPPKIVWLVQMLQFRTAISHSVTRNLGRTS